MSDRTMGIIYIVLALVLFVIGLCTVILWICLWPAALLYLVVGLIQYFKTPEETVQTV